MPKNKRKTEAIWMEAEKQWRIRVQVNGRRKPFYSSTPGRKGKIEAERKADAWIDSGASDDPRLESVWKDFLAEQKTTTGTSNYKKHESIGRIWILPRLKAKRISTITVQDMQNCINDAYKKGLARKSIANIRASFTALYSYARKSNIDLEQPDRITIPKDAPVGERRILQPDDLKMLFEIDYINRYGRQYKSHYIHAWRFAVLTGLRPGELYGLRNEDIKDGIVHIRRARNIEQETTRGKNVNAKRWFALPERAANVLARQAEMLKSKSIISPWAFPDESGNQTEQLHAYRLWQTYRDQHGIKSSPYEMRHTMISVVGADLPEKLLKTVVGHSEDMDTLGIYGHMVDGDVARAQQIIDAVFDRIFNT